MDQRICPVCKSVIDSTVTRCPYCETDLSQFATNLSQERGDRPGANQRALPQKPPEKQTAPLEGTQKEEPDEFVPDWLARIRAREAAEHEEKKAEEEKALTEKKSRSVIPDWLQSLNEDASVQSASIQQSENDSKQVSPVIIEPVPFESAIVDSSIPESELSFIEPEPLKDLETTDDWLNNLKAIESPSALANTFSEERSSDVLSPNLSEKIPDTFSTGEQIEDSPLDIKKVLNLEDDKEGLVIGHPEQNNEVPIGEFNPFSLASGEKTVAEKPDNSDEDFFKLVLPDIAELSSNELDDKQPSTLESKTGDEVEEYDPRDITFPFEDDPEIGKQNTEIVNRIESPRDSLRSEEDSTLASDEKLEINHQSAGDSDLDFSSLFSTEQSSEPGDNRYKDDLQDRGATEGQTTSDNSTVDFKFPFEEKPEDLPQMNTQPKKIVTSELDFSDIISAAENPPLNAADEEPAGLQKGDKAENELTEFVSQVPQESAIGDLGTENQLELDNLDLSEGQKPSDKSEASYPFELNALDKQIFEDLGLQPVEKPQIEVIETKASDESYPGDHNGQQETLKDTLEPENPVLEQTLQFSPAVSEEVVSIQEGLDNSAIGSPAEEILFDLSELEKTLPFLDQSLSGETQSPEISDEHQKEPSTSDSPGTLEEDNINAPLPGIVNLSDIAGIPEQQADRVDDQTDETIVQPSAIAVDPFKLDDISVAPFLPEELPEWLTDVKPAEQVGAPLKHSPKAPVEDDGSSSPEKATLPAWLAAMRPVESVEMADIPDLHAKFDETDELDGEVVTELGDVPAGGIVAKPSDLAGGIKVSSRQKTNAAILSLIAANAETLEETDKASDGKLNPTRWRTLLAILFIVFALLGGTYFAQYGLQPALFPEQVVHTFDKINAIPPEKTVLLAGDFEAGFAGEIRLTSQAVIEHLMRRNLNIAIMSINPVDSAILSDQITRGQVAVSSYQTGSKVVDLGYLPGGALAVQDLATSFSHTVPLTANRDVTSTQELLKSILLMKDFGAIIVLTDKAETARIWVEQLQTILGDTPLLIISSAQAAPLVHPYYQSGQVDGVVSGLANGLIYERILGSTGAASRNNTSLQMLSVLMAGLIMAGGFVSLVKPKMSKGKGK
jgi:hypothetical protein